MKDQAALRPTRVPYSKRCRASGLREEREGQAGAVCHFDCFQRWGFKATWINLAICEL